MCKKEGEEVYGKTISAKIQEKEKKEGEGDCQRRGAGDYFLLFVETSRRI